MNLCIFQGFISDLELKKSKAGTSYVSGSISIKRDIKEGDKYAYDNIMFMAWDKTAEFLAKYTCKGAKVLVAARVRVEKYNDQWRTTFVIDKVHDVIRPKGEDIPSPTKEEKLPENKDVDPFANFMNNSSVSNDDLPF